MTVTLIVTQAMSFSELHVCTYVHDMCTARASPLPYIHVHIKNKMKVHSILMPRTLWDQHHTLNGHVHTCMLDHERVVLYMYIHV